MSAPISSGTLEKFSTFGDLLRFLRRRVGITQLDLSLAVGYSGAQISRLEQNLRLPDITTLQARFVSALDLENEPKALARLLDLAANVRREDAPASGSCPYKGLNYFDEADADLFVGREALTAKLEQRVLALASGHQPDAMRFLAIVGASGSGKSSLVRAGLVPALRWNQASADWPMHVITPSVHPLESLAASLTHENGTLKAMAALIDDLAHEPRSLQLSIRRILPPRKAPHFLFVVDQFEELFALCRSEDERAAFIDNLLRAASVDSGPTIVVITLRADFYAHCAAYPQLRLALAQHQEYIGSMNAEELRRAIEEPARRGRWEFEPGLVDLLLHDVGHEPGALPLLSHALLETWERRRGHTLTLGGYTSSGGVRGAIAETAESVFADQFTHAQRAIARRIFLRLTELGDETSTGDTRRRARLGELILKPEEAESIQAVLKALADARLITTSEDSAEVAHEALIREWPTLRGWLEDNREGLRLHRHLTEAAQEWSAANHDQDMLFRGARLTQTREWADAHPDDLNVLEREFVGACIEQNEYEIREREAQRQRELEAAQKVAQAEQQRAAELTIINGIQQALASKLTLQAIYDLVGDKIHEITGAQTVVIYSVDQETNLVTYEYVLEKGVRVEVAPTPRTPLHQYYASLNQTWVLNSGFEEFAREHQHTLPAGQAPKSIVAVPVFREGKHRGAISIQDMDRENAFSGSDVRLLESLTASMGVALENARLFNETQRLLKETERRREEQARSARQAHRRSILLAGLSVIAIVMALVALYFGDQARRSAVAAQQNADSAQNAKAEANVQRNDAVKSQAEALRAQRVATARELAAAALSNLDVDPERSILLALQAFAVTNQADGTVEPQVEDALHRAIMSSHIVLTLSGHTLSLVAAEYSPDGSRIATGGQDGIAKVWDARTGRELITLQDTGAGDAVNGLAYSPDGTRVATANDDGTVKVWEVATGRQVMTLTGPNTYATGVAYSPDGTRLAATSGDGSTILWDATSGKLLLQIPHTGNSVAFSPDGKQFAVSLDKNDASIRDAATGNELVRLSGHAATVNAIKFSPDGSRVATVSDDSTARIWDATSGQQLLLLRLSGSGLGVAFSTDGRRLATAGFDGIPAVWDAVSGRVLLTLYGHASAVYDVSFSPDGTRLVTAGRDTTARVWDLTPGHELLTFMAAKPGGSAAAISFCPDGRRLATTSDDNQAEIWDSASGKVLLTLSGHTSKVNAVVFSPDGTKLATASDDMTARIWDANSGRVLFTLTGHTAAVIGAAFSPDGTRLATASQDNTARIWDVSTGRELLTLVGHTKPLMAIAYSPNGKYLVTIGQGHAVKLWDASSGRQLAATTTPERNPSAIAISPDGQEIVLGFVDGTSRGFQVSPDLMQMKELYNLPGHSGLIEAARFSPDGERIATASDDNTVKISDTTSGQELLTLIGPSGGIRGVAFSPDGSRLAITAGDGTVRVYLLRIGDLVSLAESRVTRSLTVEECQQYLHAPSCPPSQ